MSVDTLDGRMLKAVFIAGANALCENKALLDSMNVFPVPDGDTGTNMYLTALSAAMEVEKLPENPDVHTVAKTASAGALRGARGNSGVILSQLFRGFAKGLEEHETANLEVLATALQYAVDTAFKAIMKPKEGTILTVARETAEKALELSLETEDLHLAFTEIIGHANVVLAQTQEMLPALKAAGVVDAGGKGFVVIMETAFEILSGKREPEIVLAPVASVMEPETAPVAFSAIALEDIEFGYCTEFFIMTEGDSEEVEAALLSYLCGVGDSIVTVSDEGLVKVHVHTNNPGLVLERAMTYGSLDSVKIENMRIQHTAAIAWQGGQTEEAPQPYIHTEPSSSHKDVSFIAVASGNGFRDIFHSLGADYVIEGGQTMNPSAEEFLKALYAVPAGEIIILPNNKNIILAAKQAGDMCPEKKVYVVETRSMPQGIAALTGYVHSASALENAGIMRDNIENIHSGQITRAVRDTVLNSIKISRGDVLGIIDGDVALSHKNINEAARRLTDKLITEDTSFVTIYYGSEAKPKEAERLMEHIVKKYPDCEVEIMPGGQSVYHYVLSAE